MRFLHFADLHIDSNIGIIRKGQDVRLNDRIKHLTHISDYAKDVDYIFFSGDAYKHNHPKQEYKSIFQGFIKDWSNKSKVILISGNHDITKRHDSRHALDEFESLGIKNCFVFSQPSIKKFDDCIIVALPWVYWKKDKIIDFLQSVKISSLPIFCVAHCDLIEVSPNHDESNMRLNAENFNFCDYGAFGHIHQFNIINKNLVYPGSVGIQKWGQHRFKQGFIVGTSNNKKINFKHIEYNCRQYIEFTLTVISQNDIDNANIPNNQNAIYRIIAKCIPPIHTLNFDPILKIQCLAIHIKKIQEKSNQNIKYINIHDEDQLVMLKKYLKYKYPEDDEIYYLAEKILK